MNFSEFEKNIASKIVKDSPESGFYLSSTYQDLLNILELSKNENDKSKKITLHKSLYEFATIFLTKMLREKWAYYKSITSFVKDNDCPLDRDENIILKAYCLVAYRHKIIAHHDYIKIECENVTENTYRLTASPSHSNESWSQNLNDLKLKYQYLIPSDFNTLKELEVVNFLFYNLPLKDMKGKWNLDREAIDMLVQEVGCKSYTQDEVLKIVDEFSLIVVQNKVN